jgi:hypothetical protein
MCRRHLFTLTDRRRRVLTRVRDYHRKPYLRERAAALKNRNVCPGSPALQGWA